MVNIISGCEMILHKNFGFESSKLKIGWFTANVKLRGTPYTVNEDFTTSDSPYDLLIWFAAEKEYKPYDCELSLSNLLLIDNETNKSVLNIFFSKSKFTKRSDGLYAANFRFEKLDLVYHDLRISFRLDSSGLCPAIEKEALIELQLNKKYEEREISFWDILKGV